MAATPTPANRRDVLVAFTIVTVVMLVAVTVLSMFDKSIGNLLAVFAMSGGAWFGARVDAVLSSVHAQSNGNTRHMQETLATIATANLDNTK